MAVAAVASTAVSYKSYKDQKAHNAEAAAANREANDISEANTFLQNKDSRRDARIRARVMRSRIQQGASNAGASYSSGALGGTGAVMSSMSGEIGEQKRNILAINGINTARQRAAEAEGRSQAAALRARYAQAGFGLGLDSFRLYQTYRGT